jgi:hypothetical protein
MGEIICHALLKRNPHLVHVATILSGSGTKAVRGSGLVPGCFKPQENTTRRSRKQKRKAGNLESGNEICARGAFVAQKTSRKNAIFRDSNARNAKTGGREGKDSGPSRYLPARRRVPESLEASLTLYLCDPCALLRLNLAAVSRINR